MLERGRAVKGSGENEHIAAASCGPSQQITDEVERLATLAEVGSESTEAGRDCRCNFYEVLSSVSKSCPFIVFYFASFV